VSINKIEILGVEMFGNNVGFVNLRTITEKDGYKLPSYLFLRGHAVAILLLVNNKLLLVEQYRVPSQSTMFEAPAGMIDESGDFTGVAAAEIEEETSIKIRKEDLKPLGSYYPSVGGCDEEIFMYYCHIDISQEELQVIEGKIHGK
jgi:ADP-sugar diphosphatase